MTLLLLAAILTFSDFFNSTVGSSWCGWLGLAVSVAVWSYAGLLLLKHVRTQRSKGSAENLTNGEIKKSGDLPASLITSRTLPRIATIAGKSLVMALALLGSFTVGYFIGHEAQRQTSKATESVEMPGNNPGGDSTGPPPQRKP
jgi:hypothetical protein